MFKLKKKTTQPVESPFGFFDNLINNKGFESYHRKFFRGLDLDTFGASVTDINRREESYCYFQANADGVVIKKKVVFKNELEGLLIIKTNQYISHIKETVERFDLDDTKITTYLKLQVGYLKSLSSVIETKPELKKYGLDIHIYLMVKKLCDTYPLYFETFRSSYVNEILRHLDSIYIHKHEELNTKTETQKFDKVRTFSWTNNTASNTLTLFTILKRLGAISEADTPFDVFAKVFSGIEIDKPIKIKWFIKNHNSYANILTKMILTLMQRGYIVSVSYQELAKILEYTFIGSDDVPYQDIYNKIYGFKETLWPKGVSESILLEKLNEYFPETTKP